MRHIKAYVVLAALLAAGCAAAPEIADDAAVAAPALAATQSRGATDSGAVVPNTVIDANKIIANTPAPPICREVLKPNSNVHERRCMSADNWKRFEQAEARRAAEIVRMMQGGAYR